MGYIFILNMVIVSDRFLWQVGLFNFSIIVIKKIRMKFQLININSVFYVLLCFVFCSIGLD